MKRVVGICYTLKEVQYHDDFIVLDLDDKFDVILGLPWLRRYEPQVSWNRRSVNMPADCSSDVHPMNVLELPPPCGCTTSKCTGLMCGSVVSTDHKMNNHHIAKQDSGDCITMQEPPKDHLSNKLIGTAHGCLLNIQHPDHDQPIANDGQYRDGIAQEDRVKGISPQQPVKVSSHEVTETLNVLVNDGSRIGIHMLDLIAPPNLTS